MLRPEPLASSPRSAISTTARPQRSTRRDATMPTTPSCQSGEESTYARRRRHSAPRASSWSRASRRIASSTLWRSRLSDSSRVGKRARPRLVLGQQQLERLARVAQAPGGVDPRREPEADVRGADTGAVDARGRHQRPQAGPCGAGEPAQAGADEPAVLVDQRHDVCDRRERDQVEVQLERGRVAPRLRVERLGELEDDARTAQLGERVLGRARAHERARRAARRPGGGGR